MSYDGPIIEREFQRGKVILASPESLKPVLLDVTKIAAWGSRSVSCCVVANNMDVRKVGVARRSVIAPTAVPGMAGSSGTSKSAAAHLVLSETLVAVRDSPCKTFLTFSLTDPVMSSKKQKYTETLQDQRQLTSAASSSSSKVQEEEKSKKVRPPPHPSDAVPSALYLDTTISVSPVESDPEKSFVEMFVEYAAPTAQKAEEIAFFLEKCWVSPLLDSLADYALNISFPVQKGPTDLQFRKLYEKHEETVVRICAKKHVDDELKSRCEALLDSLYSAYRDSVAAQTQTEQMKSELYSAQILLREATEKSAQLENEVNSLQGKLMIAEHNIRAQQEEQQRNSVSSSVVGDNSVDANQAASAAAGGGIESSSQTQEGQHQSSQASPLSNDASTQKSSNNIALITGANARDKQQHHGYAASSEQRSRQVVSAISEFSASPVTSASRSAGGYSTTSSSGATPNWSKIDPTTSGGINHSTGRMSSIHSSNPYFGGGSGSTSEAALRAKFAALDVDNSGFLSVNEIAALLAAIDPADEFDIKERLASERQLTPRHRSAGSGGTKFGIPSSTGANIRAELENPARNPREAVHYREAMEWCAKYCQDRSSPCPRVTFDEFCVFMCKLERAI